LRATAGIKASVAIAIAAYQAVSVRAVVAADFHHRHRVAAASRPAVAHAEARCAGDHSLFLITIAVCIAFASLAVWAFSNVVPSRIAVSARHQAIYHRAVAA
jgi:AI-2 transport protein TqsA